MAEVKSQARRNRVAVVMLIAVALLAAPPVAEACSCLPSGPPCEEYWRADAVFLGRVESITHEGQKKSGPIARSTRRVTFTVIEGFKGVQTREVDVWTMAGGAACGYPFRAGREYFVYANRQAEAGQLRTNACTRTRPAGDADPDLDYARSLVTRARPSGRISGQVMLDFQTAQAGARTTPRPLSGLEVTLEKDGRQTRVVTDSGGVFEADGLTAGKYRVFIDVPSGHYAELWPPVVELPDDRACARVTARVYHDGRVTGRVVDGSGTPLAGLRVELAARSAFAPRSAGHRVRATTRQDGSYELTRLPAGRFVLGVNTERHSDDRPADPAVFYPGGDRPEHAAIVAVGPGEHVALRDFEIKGGLKYVRVRGVVLDSDGAPAQGARVFLKGPVDRDYILMGPVVTDSSGGFVIAAVAGREYRIFGERSRPGGTGERTDATDQVSLTAADNLLPIRLTLRQWF